MTIKEIAELCGVDQSTVWRWAQKDDLLQNAKGITVKLGEARESGKDPADFTLDETLAIIGDGGGNKALASLLAENARNKAALAVRDTPGFTGFEETVRKIVREERGIGGGKVLEQLIELTEKQQAVIETLVNGAAPRLSREQFARFFLQTHVILSEDPQVYVRVKDAFEHYRAMAYRGEGGKSLTISEFRVQIKTLYKDQVKTGVLKNGQCVYYGCKLIF
jgi:hypothetical protein